MALEKGLQDELSILLGWDPAIVVSVVENVCQARSIEDVAELITVSMMTPAADDLGWLTQRKGHDQ
jgi:hypothetical protein